MPYPQLDEGRNPKHQPTNQPMRFLEIFFIYVHTDEPKVPFEYECNQLVPPVPSDSGKPTRTHNQLLNAIFLSSFPFFFFFLQFDFFFLKLNVDHSRAPKHVWFIFLFFISEVVRWRIIHPHVRGSTSCIYCSPRHPGLTRVRPAVCSTCTTHVDELRMRQWIDLDWRKLYFYTNPLYLFKKKNHSILNISYYCLTTHEVIYLSKYSF